MRNLIGYNPEKFDQSNSIRRFLNEFKVGPSQNVLAERLTSYSEDCICQVYSLIIMKLYQLMRNLIDYNPEKFE